MWPVSGERRGGAEGLTGRRAGEGGRREPGARIFVAKLSVRVLREAAAASLRALGARDLPLRVKSPGGEVRACALRAHDQRGLGGPTGGLPGDERLDAERQTAAAAAAARRLRSPRGAHVSRLRVHRRLLLLLAQARLLGVPGRRAVRGVHRDSGGRRGHARPGRGPLELSCRVRFGGSVVRRVRGAF